MTMRAILTIAALLALAACGTTPTATPTAEVTVSDSLVNAGLDCLDGDRAACNRAHAMARVQAPGSEWEDLALRCGDLDAEPATPDETDPVWVPCPIEQE